MFRIIFNVVSHFPKPLSICPARASNFTGHSIGTVLKVKPNLNLCNVATVSSNSKQRKKHLQKELDSKQSSMKLKESIQSPEIVLLGSDGLTTTITLAEAERMAARRNMKLLSHEDKELSNKRGKKVYKMVTNREFFQSSSENKKRVKSSYMKGEMQMEVGHRISAQHLMVKLKTISRGLSKMKQIKLQVTGTATSGDMVESVLESIKAEVAKEGAKVANIQKKGFDIKCDINPPRPEKQKDTTTTEESADSK